MILTSDINFWNGSIDKDIALNLLNSIEEGQVIFLPHLPFLLSLQEQRFLTPMCADPKSKNISYDSQTSVLRGSNCQDNDLVELKELMNRFAKSARNLVDSLFPHYQKTARWGRTSFRPIEVEGRQASSYRKDDTRLHVDAFASTPVQGLRLLRVFSNINLQHPRVWKVGEPFEDVAKRFLPRVSMNQWISPRLLQKLHITKGLRTRYDHIMLQIHDSMKHDLHYQQTVPQQKFAFPGGSTWIVMTDQVSHAALSGQFLLEQTFYLPPEAMKCPEQSPLYVLERLTGRKLIEGI